MSRRQREILAALILGISAFALAIVLFRGGEQAGPAPAPDLSDLPPIETAAAEPAQPFQARWQLPVGQTFFLETVTQTNQQAEDSDDFPELPEAFNSTHTSVLRCRVLECSAHGLVLEMQPAGSQLQHKCSFITLAVPQADLPRKLVLRVVVSPRGEVAVEEANTAGRLPLHVRDMLQDQLTLFFGFTTDQTVLPDGTWSRSNRWTLGRYGAWHGITQYRYRGPRQGKSEVAFTTSQWTPPSGDYPPVVLDGVAVQVTRAQLNSLSGSLQFDPSAGRLAWVRYQLAFLLRCRATVDGQERHALVEQRGTATTRWLDANPLWHLENQPE